MEFLQQIGVLNFGIMAGRSVIRLNTALVWSELEGLDDRSLIVACIGPVLSEIRGKPQEVKTEVFGRLTAGQKALFLFMILYGHSHSEAEFYWFSADYIHQGIWERITASAEAHGCKPLVEAYRQTESVLMPYLQLSVLAGRPITVLDLQGNPVLASEVRKLFGFYHEAAADAMSRLAQYIRLHPEEFMETDQAM